MRIDPSWLTPLTTFVYRLWSALLRVRVENWEAHAAARDRGERLVYVLWHDELFGIMSRRRDLKLVAVVSASDDGELLAGPMERLGFVCARGSSSKGGLKAMREAIRIMHETGRDGVISVDGPRGPRHVAKEGAVYLAHKTDARIVPVRGRYYGRKVFARAWDRFQLPYPFSLVRVRYGDPYPLNIEGKLTGEAMRAETRRLEEALNALGREMGIVEE